MSRHNYEAIDGADGELDFEFTQSVHTRRTNFTSLVKKRIVYVIVLVATVALVVVLAASKSGKSDLSQIKYTTTLAAIPRAGESPTHMPVEEPQKKKSSEISIKAKSNVRAGVSPTHMPVEEPQKKKSSNLRSKAKSNVRAGVSPTHMPVEEPQKNAADSASKLVV